MLSVEYAISKDYLMSGENRSHNGLPSVEEAKERFLFNRIRIPFTILDKPHRITYNRLHTNAASHDELFIMRGDAEIPSQKIGGYKDEEQMEFSGIHDSSRISSGVIGIFTVGGAGEGVQL